MLLNRYHLIIFILCVAIVIYLLIPIKYSNLSNLYRSSSSYPLKLIKSKENCNVVIESKKSYEDCKYCVPLKNNDYSCGYRKKKSTITIGTYSGESNGMKSLFLLNKKNYASTYDYNFISVKETELFDSVDSNVYNKLLAIEYVLDTLKPNNWLIWLDEDVYISDDKINLKNIIDDRYLMIVPVILKPFQPDTSVLLLKKSAEVMNLLSKWKDLISKRIDSEKWKEKHEDISFLELLAANNFEPIDTTYRNIEFPSIDTSLKYSGFVSNFIKPINLRAISSLIDEDKHLKEDFSFHASRKSDNSKRVTLVHQFLIENDLIPSKNDKSNKEEPIPEVKSDDKSETKSGGKSEASVKSLCPQGFPEGFEKETVETACRECGHLTISRDYACASTNVDELYGGKNGAKLGIVTMYDNISPQLIEITRPNKMKYAEKYGHKFYDLSSKDLVEEARKEGPLYAKLYAVKSVLDKHDWIMWSDSDSMFINAKRRLIDLLDNNYHIIATATLLSPTHGGYKIPNTGSFFVRNTPKGKEFLEKWIAAGRLNHMYKDWGDQGSLMELIRKINPAYETDGTFKFIEHRTMNSEIPWHLPTDLVVHTPGSGLGHKLEKLSKFKDIHLKWD